MRPKSITITMAAADADSVCLSQTPAAGGVQSLTIAGVLASGGVATMDVPRHVSITSNGNDSGRTFTVTGTDRYGHTITETITGPNTTTVKGTYNFKTVTAVTVDDDTAGAITVGSADELESQWIPVAIRHKGTSATVTLSSTANFTYSLQYTLTNVLAGGFREYSANVYDAITDSTSSDGASWLESICAVRVEVKSYVAGSCVFEVVQG